MDGNRCLAGTEIFLKSEEHCVYYMCIVMLVQDSGLQYGKCPWPGVWPSQCPAGWLLSEQSLGPLLGETW